MAANMLIHFRILDNVTRLNYHFELEFNADRFHDSLNMSDTCNEDDPVYIVLDEEYSNMIQSAAIEVFPGAMNEQGDYDIRLTSESEHFRIAQETLIYIPAMYEDEQLVYRIVEVEMQYYLDELATSWKIPRTAFLKVFGVVYALTTNHNIVEGTLKIEFTDAKYRTPDGVGDEEDMSDDEENGWVYERINHPQRMNWNLLLKAINGGDCCLPLTFLADMKAPYCGRTGDGFAVTYDVEYDSDVEFDAENADSDESDSMDDSPEEVESDDLEQFKEYFKFE